MTNIYLHANNQSHRGPGMVYQNLVKGIEELGNYALVSSPEKADYIGCLQLYNIAALSKNNLKDILYGPNMFVHPEELGQLLNHIRTYVLPSQWSINLTKQTKMVNHVDFKIWSVGIDTDEWKPRSQERKKQDCFLYVKNRSSEDRKLVEMLLHKFKQSYQVLSYGSYQEHQLKEACANSSYCVLLTGTESQGVAYMQVLSSGLPCYVFEQSKWISENGQRSGPATSVPYFNDQCGSVAMDLDLLHFESFLASVDSYEPRSYITENHTLKQSAEKYIELLKAAKGEEER